MKRAAVLLSVKKTGNLPELRACAAATAGMQAWVQAQGFDSIEVISDEVGPVEPRQIRQAIKRIVDAGTTEQLLVYFTGHGVNIRYGEYWLLSDAPSDTQAAVNVEGSVVLARQSGIPHVVFVSDACRTAAEGVQAQAVTGSEIFPNDGPSGPEMSVDLFFACTVGKPALEIKDAATAAGGYSAIYTRVLVEALNGDHPEAIQETVDGDTRIGLVRPRPLKRALTDEVARRLAQPPVRLGVSQTPDARITSDEDVWLSKVLLRATRGGQTPHAPVSPPPTLLSVSQTRLRTLLQRQAASLMERVLAPDEPLGKPFDLAAAAGVDQADLLSRALTLGAQGFGPTHFETRCGFKVQGAKITGVFSTAALSMEQFGDSLVHIDQFAGPAANILIIIEGGAGVVVPAIPEFVGALTFEDGELVKIAYEPADTSARWHEFRHQMDELRALGNLIATSARFGMFRLEGEDALAIARRLQLAKGVAPSMAVYAAYAYNDLNRRDRLTEIHDYLFADLGFRFFDIALLTRGLEGTVAGRTAGVFPFVPMLAQGWALLSAHRVKLPHRLEGLERRLRSSLWTLFDPDGVAAIRDAMHAGEVR
jgi:hypothetical protein